MSQNGPYSGPPWSDGNSDEPYAQPSDPWGSSGAGVAEPHWGANPPSIPQQPVSYHSAQISGAPVSPDSMGGWGQAPTPPKRNTGILALVVVLGLLMIVGLGTTGWLLKQRNDRNRASAQASTSTSTSAGTTSTDDSQDARNVTAGQCVVNRGTNDEPDMRKTPCASGTYEVLKVYQGQTTGEKDAENKCASVSGYTNWYFYDSEFNDLDFVLCLKKQ